MIGDSIGRVTKRNRCHGPAPSSVRRLVERRRNGLQARKQSYRHEWNAAPDIGGDHRPTGVPGLAEKIDVLMDQTKFDERPGDDRELRIVDPPEGDRRQHGWRDERQQHDRANERLHRHPAVEQEREVEPRAELEHAGHDRIERRVEHHEPEYLIVSKGNEVGEADETSRLTDFGVGHAEPESQGKRIGEKPSKITAAGAIITRPRKLRSSSRRDADRRRAGMGRAARSLASTKPSAADSAIAWREINSANTAPPPHPRIAPPHHPALFGAVIPLDLLGSVMRRGLSATCCRCRPRRTCRPLRNRPSLPLTPFQVRRNSRHRARI